MLAAVNALALTTGSNPVPASKKARGYTFVRDEFARACLTPVDSEVVRPKRAEGAVVRGGVKGEEGVG